MNFKRLEKSSHSHLDFIDFIKGLAAVSVILLHTLPAKVLYDSFAIFHIWQAVPIFLFITFYFGFRNLENKPNIFKGYYSIDRIKKIFMKLWFPLIILAAFEALFFIFLGNKKMVLSCLFCYGNGPGSYYIWCYMQLWLLIPFIYFFIKKTNILLGGHLIDYQCFMRLLI